METYLINQVTFKFGTLNLKFQMTFEKGCSQKYCHTPEIGVKIIRYNDGTPECRNYQDFKNFLLDDDMKLAKDEFLVLRTRNHYRKVSF